MRHSGFGVSARTPVFSGACRCQAPDLQKNYIVLLCYYNADCCGVMAQLPQAWSADDRTWLFPFHGFPLRCCAQAVMVMVAMDNSFWKWMERGQVAVGTLATLATLYFTAGLYYGWNQPSSRKDYVLVGGLVMPPWLIIALGVLAVLMLLTSWGMMAIRLREEKKRETSVPTPKQTATLSLSLEDQLFRLRRTFILSNLDELGQWFCITIGLSIVDYRDREKDEFLGYLLV